MKSERWARLKDLLDQALALPQDQRAAFMQRECGSDTELLQQLEGLVDASQDLDEFIAPPKDHVIPIDKILDTASDEGLLGTIGGYRLLQELGRGGRGVVYLAKPVESDRLVALKVLSLTALPSAVSVERFQREARSVEKLEHPAIVKVRSLEHDLGRPFLVMDYVDGPNLASEISKLAQGAEVDQPSVLSASDEEPAVVAAKLVHTLAEAAHHAHQRGIVHRDIKPQNVLLDHSGKPYLVDFGLARDEAEVTLTRTGEVEGTPNYMSPEQVRAERAKVDHRTDVYSLGVVLYELLTLKRPFEAPTANQVMSNITSRAPLRVRKLNEAVPRDLELVCMKAMEKNPRHRYQSAAELAEDLSRFLRHESVRAVAPNVGQLLVRHIARRPLPWGLSAAAVILIAATSLLAGWMAEEEAFSKVESMLDQLNLVDGQFDAIPDLSPVLASLGEVIDRYGQEPASLAAKVQAMEAWREAAKANLDDKFLGFERSLVSIGYWLPAAEPLTGLTDPEALEAYTAGLTALGHPASDAVAFDQIRKPKVLVELRESALANTCQVYLSRYSHKSGSFSDWRGIGTVANLGEGFEVQADTQYRLGFRAADGRFAECTLLAVPRKGIRKLVVGLNSRDQLEGMIPVEGASYAWGMSGKEGGPTTPFEVPNFLVDELLVSFGEFWEFLDASGNEQSGNWPDHPVLIDKLKDKAVTFLEASDMAAFAAWHGKRLITVPEFAIAAGGPEVASFPDNVIVEDGHETMPFGMMAIADIPDEEVPADQGRFWVWMTRVLPSVNNVPDFDQGPTGMKMIWGTIRQMTESAAYFSQASSSYSPFLWVVGASKDMDLSAVKAQGLKVMDTQWRAIPNSFTSFRCALSDNPIP